MKEPKMDLLKQITWNTTAGPDYREDAPANWVNFIPSTRLIAYYLPQSIEFRKMIVIGERVLRSGLMSQRLSPGLKVTINQSFQGNLDFTIYHTKKRYMNKQSWRENMVSADFASIIIDLALISS